MMHNYPYILSFLALTLCACGPQTSNQSPGDTDPTGPPELSDLTGEQLAATTLGPDPYEIGTSWYDYTQSTHVLTPRAHVYGLTRGGELQGIFEIQSYYNERGESGFFTLNTRTLNEGQWSDVSTLITSKNIKDDNICFDAQVHEINCTDPDAFLIFRIVRRALPDAGFAVKDPGIFLLSQYSDNPNEDQLIFVEADSINEIDPTELATQDPRPSSAANPEDSRVGWLHDSPEGQPVDDIYFQVTSSLHAVLWKTTQIEHDAEAQTVSISFDALCQRVQFNNQRQFDEESLQSFTITLPTTTAYSATQVTLCDPDQDTATSGEQHHARDTPYSGTWESDPAFDWFVEQYDGRISLRLAPGNLLWNWSKSEAAELQTPSMQEPLDPGAVWDTFY